MVFSHFHGKAVNNSGLLIISCCLMFIWGIWDIWNPDTEIELILIPFEVIFWIVCIIIVVIYTIRNHKCVKDFIPLMMLVIFFCSPFMEISSEMKFRVQKKKMEEVVKLVETDNLRKSDNADNIILPAQYKTLSSYGEIEVDTYKADTIILFGKQMGMSTSGFSFYIYYNGSEKGLKNYLEEKYNYADSIGLEKVDKNWFDVDISS